MHKEIESILASVSTITGYTEHELLSPRRAAGLATARQYVYWMAVQHTRLSYLRIGVELYKDHTTIMYGYKQAQLKLNNTVFRFQLDEIVQHWRSNYGRPDNTSIQERVRISNSDDGHAYPSTRRQ